MAGSRGGGSRSARLIQTIVSLRDAFLPAVVPTSGRIQGEQFRMLFTLADWRTHLSFQALGELEAVDVDSEVY